MCNPVLISLTANFYKSNPFMYFAENIHRIQNKGRVPGMTQAVTWCSSWPMVSSHSAHRGCWLR